MSIVDSSLLAFAGVALLVAMTPGPDMATVTRNGLAYGRRGALLTSLGIGVALICWVGAAAFGVAAVLAASALAFTLVKLAGAAYLAYLGIRSLVSSWRRHEALEQMGALAPASHIFRTGYLSAILNPKLGVFFVTLLPQFVAPGQAVLPQMLLLGAIFIAIGVTWMTAYGLAVTKLREAVGLPRVRAWMERVSGVVLVGFAARLALERA